MNSTRARYGMAVCVVTYTNGPKKKDNDTIFLKHVFGVDNQFSAYNFKSAFIIIAKGKLQVDMFVDYSFYICKNVSLID